MGFRQRSYLTFERHLNNESRDFLNKKKLSNVNLNLANNQSTKIVGAGVASFTADFFGEVRNVTLDNTLHVVPHLRTNLLFVSKIADKGCEIKKDDVLVFGANGNVKLIGNRVGDLYFARVPRNLAFTSSNDNFSFYGNLASPFRTRQLQGPSQSCRIHRRRRRTRFNQSQYYV
jgi:hypothetical protein